MTNTVLQYGDLAGRRRGSAAVPETAPFPQARLGRVRTRLVRRDPRPSRQRVRAGACPAWVTDPANSATRAH